LFFEEQRWLNDHTFWHSGIARRSPNLCRTDTQFHGEAIHSIITKRISNNNLAEYRLKLDAKLAALLNNFLAMSFLLDEDKTWLQRDFGLDRR
jgi:hypothetical protein